MSSNSLPPHGLNQKMIPLPPMNDRFQSAILESTKASAFYEKEIIQELWSGYGQIIRISLEDAPINHVVVKHVQLAQQSNHARGWNTNQGHQRKIKSYQVETKWYSDYSQSSTTRLPKCLAVVNQNDEVLMILEDLNEAGFSLRKHSVNWKDISTCLEWLAKFHASFLNHNPEGLWSVGTYWHLDTRPEELAALDDQILKEAAPLIDQKLNNCKFKTFVHGDAKLANFCFSNKGNVAGVDFQYVGGGCGMKDVAYFIGSCLAESECESLEGDILDTYFMHLQSALGVKNQALESEWRSLYRVAWADFHRFLKGWSPGHWKINSYSDRITKEVIKKL